MVAKLSLVECMAAVEDPRVDRTKAHDLQDILVLAVQAMLAVLCGADGWEDIELFADGGGDYVLARNRGQSPRDRVVMSPPQRGIMRYSSLLKHFAKSPAEIGLSRPSS